MIIMLSFLLFIYAIDSYSLYTLAPKEKLMQSAKRNLIFPIRRCHMAKLLLYCNIQNYLVLPRIVHLNKRNHSLSVCNCLE